MSLLDIHMLTKKYQLTATHSEVLVSMNAIQSGKVLDLGCGVGRNSLFLALQGFTVDAWDHSAQKLQKLNYIIATEQLEKNIHTRQVDLNQCQINAQYDFILSTVVLMFLQPETIPVLIQNMQKSTVNGGYNLIVSAMSTEDFPCPADFSFAFKAGELSQYYKDWQLIKYNEDIGQLHRLDSNGQRIQLRFATMLAQKI